MRKLLSETGLPLGVASPDTSKSIAYQPTFGYLTIPAEVNRADEAVKMEVDQQLIKVKKTLLDPPPEEIEKFSEVAAAGKLGGD